MSECVICDGMFMNIHIQTGNSDLKFKLTVIDQLQVHVSEQ